MGERAQRWLLGVNLWAIVFTVGLYLFNTLRSCPDTGIPTHYLEFLRSSWEVILLSLAALLMTRLYLKFRGQFLAVFLQGLSWFAWFLVGGGVSFLLVSWPTLF